jgi:2-polyprenyl-3-methyl-5-hydroxy-6-metoxy-1,4-benzoquinol methylase/uncharacterized protein YbaR (Trm112 family)
MKPALLELLRCPAAGGRVSLTNGTASAEIEEGTLTCDCCGIGYPIVRGIPRFVEADNYANNFGFQWNRFRETQLDSHTGVPISERRFLRQTGWNEQTLRGQLVLDAGCGAGRFAEVALALGAELVAIDFSSAVDAAYANLQPHPHLHLVQADIYRLPFAPGTFDFVYSLGVLQHTPDVRKSVDSLVPMVKPGGGFTVDLYLRRWSNFAEPKYWLRPFTTRMQQERLFGLVERFTPALMRISRALARVPLVGGFLRRLVPVANYEGIHPLNETQLQQWAVLDTFDWLGPRYDQPQTPSTLRRWLEEAKLEAIEVMHESHLTGRAVKPR